ncbi:50S ribosomal protein L10 [Mycoplasmopsis columbinasalis]|uniref:Large ribosomal subunit protein uL10 n=1 Tax=Mycoplasmopsis columbinasalis TaxID=114880 RepID=A0A449BAJ5_9BACT|nr:50S ribosomal protein L10 [Mycoplasmopsis columbinasalis]VEU78224.1 50s ribosomal protein L10 [Mycoplasmopsis columbinasalis]
MSAVKESALRLAKKEIVKEIVNKLQTAKSLVTAEYRGLTVAELTKLRRLAKKNNIDIKVYKNRLFKLAAQELGYSDLSEHLVGPNIFAFGVEDELAPYKLLANFAKENKIFVNKAGLFEGKVVNAQGVAEIATLPNYQEALTILARSLMGGLQQLSLSLKLVSEKKEA